MRIHGMILVSVLSMQLFASAAEAGLPLRPRPVNGKAQSEGAVLRVLNSNINGAATFNHSGDFKLLSKPEDPFSAGVTLSPRALKKESGAKAIGTLELHGVSISCTSTFYGPGSSDRVEMDGKLVARYWPHLVPKAATLPHCYMLRLKANVLSSSGPSAPGNLSVSQNGKPLQMISMEDGTLATLFQWIQPEMLYIKATAGGHTIVFEWVRLTRVQ